MIDFTNITYIEAATKQSDLLLWGVSKPVFFFYYSDNLAYSHRILKQLQPYGDDIYTRFAGVFKTDGQYEVRLK